MQFFHYKNVPHYFFLVKHEATVPQLVLMMFPNLRVPWTITDNFLWEIEEDICQNEIKKRRGNNDSK